MSESQSLENMITIARDTGFTEIPEKIQTKYGEWGIFDRRDFEMPSFPEGSTIIQSMLAFYSTEQGISQAVLRISEESFSDTQFYGNLQKLTKHYIERPKILGFPSKAMTKSKGILYSIASGIGIGALAGYLLTESPEGVITGSLVGEAALPSLYYLLHSLSEKYARAGIPLTNLYVGKAAKDMLSKDKRYLLNLLVKKELYQNLLEEGLVENPEEFIQKVYPNIWNELVQLKLDEIGMKKKGIEVKEEALKRMVAATRLLPSVTPVAH